MQYQKRRHPVGLGPSHATRACERVPLAMLPEQKTSIYANGHPARSGSGDPELQSRVLPFRSRGTGPRATVSGHLPVGETSRSRCNGIPRRFNCEGQALALRKRSSCPFGIRRSRTTEGRALQVQSRGTGPRATGAGHLLGSIARDRPSRYGNRPSCRRARACPSPCCLNKKPSIYGSRPLLSNN